MSAFDEPNADAYTVGLDEGSKGPRLGFQEAFAASWDAQTKVNSQFGLERAFRDVEYAQIKKMRDAGLEPHRSLDADLIAPVNVVGADLLRMSPYGRVAKAIVDGDETGAHDDAMQMRDEQIKRLQKEHPDLGLQTYSEMFKTITDQAQAAVKRNALDTTTMGAVGGFLGGAAGAMDPLRNPVNFAAGLVGGGGGPFARMAVQGAVQGGVEGFDIATNDNPRLLTGEVQTPGQQAARVGLAMAGGAIMQGAFEGGGAAISKYRTGKWFNDLVPDKLPTRETTAPQPTPDLMPGERMPPGRPINEYPDFDTFAQAHGVNVEFERSLGGTREAKSRTAADRDYVAAELDRWDGPQPHEIAARADTAAPPGVEPGVRYDGAAQRYVDRLDTIDDVARRLDPDLFAKYDKLAAQRDELRTAIERGREVGDLRPNADRADIKARFEAQRATQELSTRQQIMHVDEQMRDMAPLVSRATGAADREWRATPVDFNTLNYLKNLEERTGWRYRGEDKPSLTEQPLREKAPEAQPPTQTLADKVPLSRLSPEQNAKLRPGNDVADRVAIAATDAAEAVDAKIEQFVKMARELIRAEEKKTEGLVTEAPKFKDWIAGTKVVDDNGRPLRVYHGTKAQFEQFDAAHAGDGVGGEAQGLFFTSSAKEASGYAAGDASGGRVIPSYLAMHDPVDLSFAEHKISNIIKDDAAIAKALKEAEKLGADGLILRDINGVKGHDIYVVAHGDQVANAITLEHDFKGPVEHITMPDGSRLHLDNDKLPGPDGKEVTVRDFLREMDKDQHALDAVVTCSRPS